MIGFLSDAHGNLRGFERGINVLRAHGVTRFIFLGDAVGYVPGPGVVHALRGLAGAITCLKGNHDAMMLTGAWEPERDTVYQHAVTRETLSASDIAFIATWPERHEMRAGNYSLLCMHGGPSNPLEQYIYPESALDDCAGLADIVFMGHTHRPFHRTIGSTTCINVGSCGLPRDHGGLGCVSLFDPDTGLVQILRYDLNDIAHDLREAQNLHDDVAAVFDRRTEPVTGELVDIQRLEIQ